MQLVREGERGAARHAGAEQHRDELGVGQRLGAVLEQPLARSLPDAGSRPWRASRAGRGGWVRSAWPATLGDGTGDRGPRDGRRAVDGPCTVGSATLWMEPEWRGRRGPRLTAHDLHEPAPPRRRRRPGALDRPSRRRLGADAGRGRTSRTRPPTASRRSPSTGRDKRNAFRPQTLFELARAFELARDDDSVGVIVLTGAGDYAFCSGGDQMIRGDDGYIGRRRRSPPRASAGSTSWTCRSRSAGCPSRSSRWSPATRSAAATCCTSCAT